MVRITNKPYESKSGFMYEPHGARVLIALGRYGANSIIELPQDRQDSTAVIAVGKILACGNAIEGFEPGDWIEVPRSLIAGQVTAINDLRLGENEEISKLFTAYVIGDQIIAKITFSEENEEPGLLTKEDVDNGARANINN